MIRFSDVGEISTMNHSEFDKNDFSKVLIFLTVERQKFHTLKIQDGGGFVPKRYSLYGGRFYKSVRGSLSRVSTHRAVYDCFVYYVNHTELKKIPINSRL